MVRWVSSEEVVPIKEVLESVFDRKRFMSLVRLWY